MECGSGRPGEIKEVVSYGVESSFHPRPVIAVAEHYVAGERCLCSNQSWLGTSDDNLVRWPASLDIAFVIDGEELIYDIYIRDGGLGRQRMRSCRCCHDGYDRYRG